MARRIAVKPIHVKEVIELREVWLVAPGLLEVAEFDRDKAATTRHLGAVDRGKILGMVSLYREPRPAMIEGHAWRMRGLAVGSASRGAGLGRALIEAAERLVLKEKGNLIWSNVRTRSIDFFTSVGFEQVGDVFELRDQGEYLRILLQPKKRRR